MTLTHSQLVAPKRKVRWLLHQLGLPRTATLEEAAPKVKDRVVFARRNNRDDIAALWSEAQAMLKRRLPRLCNDCKKKTSPRSLRCVVCAKKQMIGVEKPYKPHASEFGLTNLVESFVFYANRPFFLPEVSYWVHQLKPHVPKSKIARSVYDALRCMKRNGLIVGGKENWNRYEPVAEKLSLL